MKKSTLTFGAKINCTFAALAAVLALTVWFGFRTERISVGYRSTSDRKNARKIELAGALNAAESDMAVAQRGRSHVHLRQGSRPDEPKPRHLFQREQNVPKRALAEIAPAARYGRGQATGRDMEYDCRSWLPAYAELERLVDAGDAGCSARVLTGQDHAVLRGCWGRLPTKLVEDRDKL